jgi:lipid-A-disaccharide synthase
MLAKRPMVVGYRLAPLTYAVVTGFGMLSTDLYALPNILAGKAVVPELMQRDCTPTKLADAVLQWFRAPRRCRALRQEFERMHLALHTGSGAAANAARAIERVAGLHPDVGGAYREP